MITDSELVVLMEDQEVLKAVLKLKTDFLTSEMDFIHIGDDDFVSLVLLTPSIGIALSNNSISLYEELMLNRKARKLSRGSYFLKIDPISPAVNYLISNFEVWEDRFYDLIKLMLHTTLKDSPVISQAFFNKDARTGKLGRDILNAPYIFVKFLGFLFVEDVEDLLNKRGIEQAELKKVKYIGEKLGIAEAPVFQDFVESFELRELKRR
ncbi:hypothetical protein [Chondrinema litorale]|uniref:hypothetical protein n=1 Tax=Chondrinema litorale TaxID=2994555 RepID=UPI002543E352|nr:hypothetical protein [Chondrinema litorale]UZR94805.1 hypothetical protein OQ292_03125 [Chondrinema litorale]